MPSTATSVARKSLTACLWAVVLSAIRSQGTLAYESEKPRTQVQAKIAIDEQLRWRRQKRRMSVPHKLKQVTVKLEHKPGVWSQYEDQKDSMLKLLILTEIEVRPPSYASETLNP